MQWSKRIGQWFGIEVRVHATFGLLLLWVLGGVLSDTGSLTQALLNLAFVLAIFTFVVLHEYGHALTARRFGIRTRGITLYPIGGVAMLEGMPEDPREELLIAAAGPAVNFALAAGIWLLSQVTVGGAGGLGALAEWMVDANLVMGVFNLVPALPMDGGRILRSLLSMRMQAPDATAIASRVARTVAVLMGGYAMWQGQSTLAFIAVFVWIAAGAEARAARVAGASGQRRRRPAVPRTQVFRAREPGGTRDDGLHVVFGRDGRRLFIGQL